MMIVRNVTPLLVAIGLLLLPLVLYVGSYCLLAGQSYSDYRPFASYRYGGKAAEIFYKPLELADRRLRPRRWEPLFVQPAVGEGP
jgi:hypothetical protein